MSKTCANCGAEVPEGARFCDNCGMLVSERASPQEASPQDTPPQQPPAAPPTPPSPAEQPVFFDPPSSQQETLRWEQPSTQQEEALPLTSPPPAAQPPISVPPPPHHDGKPRRGLLILGGGFAALVGIGIAIWLLVPYGQGEYEVGEAPPTEESTPADEASKPAQGYQLVEHDSGNLSVEVPSGWEVDTEKYADLEGNDVSESEGIGPAITASSDLYAWNNIGGQGPGVYLRASRVMARSFTDDDQFLDLPSLNYSYSCQRGARQDFDRSPYSGRMQEWKNCSGTHDELFVAAAPEDRECLLTLQIETHTEADREAARHILDTFDADCRAIT